MKSIITCCSVIAVSSAFMTGCLNLPSQVDLAKAANDAQVINITTGDGTFENYKATGYHTSTEIGFAVGIPGLFKFMEVYPKQSNEEQMAQLAKDAKSAGANAVINAKPPKEVYTGFPFFFFGLYIDKAEGTGIKTK